MGLDFRVPIVQKKNTKKVPEKKTRSFYEVLWKSLEWKIVAMQ